MARSPESNFWTLALGAQIVLALVNEHLFTYGLTQYCFEITLVKSRAFFRKFWTKSLAKRAELAVARLATSPFRFFIVTDDGSYFPSGLNNAMRLYDRFNANIDRRLAESGPGPTQRRILLELFEKPNVVDADLATFLALDRSFLAAR